MGEQVAARFRGGVAQLGEHLPCKQGVKSSNLSISTRGMKRYFRKMYLENFIQISQRFSNLNTQIQIKTSEKCNKQTTVLCLKEHKAKLIFEWALRKQQSPK